MEKKAERIIKKQLAGSEKKPLASKICVADKSKRDFDGRSVCVDVDRVSSLPKCGKNQTWVVVPYTETSQDD